MTHESLRTSCRTVAGDNRTVLMVIEDEPRVCVSDSWGDDAALGALVRGELQSSPAGDECVLRLVLFSHADGRQSLVLSAPRLSMDAFSVEVFFRDLQQAYASRRSGMAWRRGGVVQYADYSQWQFEEGSASGRQKQIATDREAQMAALPHLNLPLEPHGVDTAPLDAAPVDTAPDTVQWTLPAPLARRLRSLGNELEGGLRSVLLTGWFVAVWHAAGRPERLAVDTMLTRRPFPEMLTSIGQFETPMPVVAAISDETTLTELLQSVDLELDSLEHLAESAVQPTRRHAESVPGFGFTDVAEFTSPQALAFSDLWIEPPDGPHKVGLSVQGVDVEIRLRLRYRADRMTEDGAVALLACLRAALSALGGDLSVAVPALAMLDEDRARQLVAATNPAQPPERPLPHWYRQVEQIAQRMPGATAIRTATRVWSYRELDHAANRLANELVARGVAVGALVGLCMQRCDLAIVAMLAIAKAGGGYVAFDPNLPAKRRSAIMSAVGFTHLVATEAMAPHLPPECDVVVMDADLSVCGHRSTACPEVVTTDNDPAYVVFTSGSTGTPKGVLVGHGQLAAYLDGVLDRLRLTGAIDSVALSSLATDLGNTALFPPLISGGALLVVAADVAADAQKLADLMSQECYDLIKMTPSHLEAVLTVAETPEKLMPRQALVVGGEPFSWGQYNLLRSLLGGCRLFNHYGPTETTVGVLCGQVVSDDLAALASSVPLGTPMRHARAYVLDSLRRPLPVGLPGELWIGGCSVSQGYLSATAEQQQRFLDDPFSPVPSARMYRTGDKVRFLPDRSIEFLGRIDRQVKVRGFRVELGEIEAVMRQHPRVTASLAVASGEGTAAHIVGYLIDVEGSRGSAPWLRDFLTERLADFMVPAHLVALDAFPLTSSGKVDASMLPGPGVDGPGSTSYAEPRSPTEKKVADTMAQLLRLKRAGADDDFFELGGHSLLAVQLVAQLRHEFEVNLKLRTVFEYPLVSQLAELIDQLLREKADRHDSRATGGQRRQP